MGILNNPAILRIRVLFQGFFQDFQAMEILNLDRLVYRCCCVRYSFTSTRIRLVNTMSANNRSHTIIGLLVAAGFVAGLVFGAYLFYAWIPPEVINRDASPRMLRAVDNVNTAQVQYREVYLSYLARRFKEKGGSAEALADVENALGVTLGDTSRAQAVAMTQTAFDAARIENAQETTANKNPDQSGWFTLVDQMALSDLLKRLDEIKNEPVKLSADAGSARNIIRILGLLPLLLALVGVVLTVNYAVKQRFGLTFLNDLLGPVDGDVSLGATGEDRTFVQVEDYSSPTSGYAEGAPARAMGDTAFDSEDVVDGNEVPLEEPPIIGETLVTPVPPSTLSRGAPGARTTSIGESLICTLAPTTYQHGIDNYDEGFEIKSSSGEFIGECGVSIAERIDPASDEVCALAVWVFDKHAFKHVAKVLLTDYAYKDEVVRGKLAQRGDAVHAQPRPFSIETATLNVLIDVSNLKLDASKSYFETVTLAFNVYKKP